MSEDDCVGSRLISSPATGDATKVSVSSAAVASGSCWRCRGESMSHAQIIYFHPGLKQSSTQTHTYWRVRLSEPPARGPYWDRTRIAALTRREEVYILDGRLRDRTLQRWIEPGEYACRPPGMVHGPYEADEKDGCRQLVMIRYQT